MSNKKLVNPALPELLFQCLDSPPRATWIGAGFVGICVMLELKMEAQPVHLLEYVVLVSVLDYWLIATLAMMVKLGQMLRTVAPQTLAMAVFPQPEAETDF